MHLPRPVVNAPRLSLACATLGLALGLGAGFRCPEVRADDWPQWRGPARDGTSAEKGLLQEWPAAGPRLAWQIGTAGAGYAAPSVVGTTVYLQGNEGTDNEFVRAYAVADGRQIWEARLGKVGNPDQQPKFPAARSTPTLHGDALYALGSDGDLACVELASGKVRWRKSLRSDFGGRPGIWAYSESPLVDGSVVVCTPAGEAATVVALDLKTGEAVWRTVISNVKAAAYTSIVPTEIGGQRAYVQMVDSGLVGLDARTGALQWRYDQTVSKFKANIPTPVTRGEAVYSAGAGTGGGLVRVKKIDGRLTADPGYFSAKLPTAIGGAVLVGNHLYGTSAQAMLCVDFDSGKILWEERALGAAALCYVDGRLYLNAENGEVGLVEPSPEGLREKGRFTPPGRPARSLPMEKPWAYPVVANGRLYLRDHGQLWAYDIRAAKP